jgi:hypothetical protein
MSEKPQVSIMFSGGSFRGDHTADVLIAYDYRPDETVAELVARVLGDKPPCHGYWSDHIQIRIVRATDE